MSPTPMAMRTASAASEGTEPLDGGSPPVSSRVAAVMIDRHRNHPRMNAAPFAVPRREVRMRMNGISGSGSKAIARPMTMRSTNSGHPPGGRAQRT